MEARSSTGNRNEAPDPIRNNELFLINLLLSIFIVLIYWNAQYKDFQPIIRSKKTPVVTGVFNSNYF
jgi:hypothetical protein